jgi:hypothetical protein
MSYEFLVTIVVINAFVTLWLWQKLSSKQVSCHGSNAGQRDS